MAYELKEGQGSLFRNERKESEKQPDHTGSIMIGGQVYRLSAWINESKDKTKKYFSIKASPADEKPQQGQRSSLRDEMSDDIPFGPEWR